MVPHSQHSKLTPHRPNNRTTKSKMYKLQKLQLKMGLHLKLQQTKKVCKTSPMSRTAAKYSTEFGNWNARAEVMP